MCKHIEKASAPTEAPPRIQDFRGSIVVVKVDGGCMA